MPGLMRFIRAHMRERRAGLTLPQFRSLVFLSLHGKSSLSELADHIGLSLPGASRMVDLLVRRGLLKRQPHPQDRRRVALTLTARGRQTFQAAHEATQVELARHLAALSPADLSRLTASMHLLGRAFKAEPLARSISRNGVKARK